MAQSNYEDGRDGKQMSISVFDPFPLEAGLQPRGTSAPPPVGARRAAPQLPAIHPMLNRARPKEAPGSPGAGLQKAELGSRV